ncbi:hypothetical protein EON81_23235 [bacterium]|nr:MAG: hypothetical protein EON81_23235 [bacterium]
MKSAHITAEVTFRPHSQGGLPAMPVGSGFAPYLRTDLVPDELAVRVEDVPGDARFGEPVQVKLELSYHPDLDYGPLREGVRFVLILGSKTVAEGVCTSPIVAN